MTVIGQGSDRPDPWAALASLTHARVGLGRRGSSLPTDALLRLRSDQIHAAASVHAPFDAAGMVEVLRAAGVEAVLVRTTAEDREAFLTHPGRGRTLSDDSRDGLCAMAVEPAWDVLLIISDGLSTEAVMSHALPVAINVIEQLRQQGLSVAPVVVAASARVGLLNDAGAAIGARAAAILLGERPGLSSADSLGAYLEVNPHAGLTDADRNCISNIRPGGLDPVQAAENLTTLICEALRQEVSGTGLKIEYAVGAQEIGRSTPT